MIINRKSRIARLRRPALRRWLRQGKGSGGQANSSDAGFTLVELIVAMALFVFVASVSSAVFVKSLRSQRAIVAMVLANDNTFLTLEQMARDMRVGSNFVIVNDQIDFKNPRGEGISYRYRDNSIERSVNAAAYEKITADNVDITDFRIYRMGEAPGDGAPTRVTLSLRVGAKDGDQNFYTEIQTTTTVRNLDN